MAIQSFELDPNAQAYTDDEIITKINNASSNITRAGSVDAAARPLASNEVTSAELSASAAKDNLDAMADTARGYVQTDPQSGEFPIVAIQRTSAGRLDVDYDNVAV